MTPAEETALKAVRYVLHRAQTDVDFNHVAGRFTETFAQLCAAESALTGRSIEVVGQERARTDFRGRTALVLELKERLSKFEDVQDKDEQIEDLKSEVSRLKAKLAANDPRQLGLSL